VCARCREQVLLCSRCDRGQRYCGRACSLAARLESRRAAGRRYQRSRAGRLAHAARSRRWRQRRQECASEQRADHDATADVAAVICGGVINFVTHQGSSTPALDAPLTPGAELAAMVTGALTPPSAVRCRRCAAALPQWVRQGFLRHGMRPWPARVIEPSP
jgi:hypothetical protein